MNICDFANSYIMWTVPPNPSDNRQPGHMPWGNSARIQLDARIVSTLSDYVRLSVKGKCPLRGCFQSTS